MSTCSPRSKRKRHRNRSERQRGEKLASSKSLKNFVRCCANAAERDVATYFARRCAGGEIWCKTLSPTARSPRRRSGKFLVATALLAKNVGPNPSRSTTG